MATEGFAQTWGWQWGKADVSMRDDEHKAESAGQLAACPPVGTSSLTGRFRQIRCEWRRKSCRLKAIEDDFWTGGPEACRKYADEQCLVAFSELAGVMSRDDIAIS